MPWPSGYMPPPVMYLTAANVACAGIGFVQGLMTAATLGDKRLGIVGVIAGINTTVLGILDIRLADLAGKLYYRTDVEGDLKAYRASVLQICLMGNALISLVLCALGLAASILSIHWFTQTPVAWRWLVAQTLVLALANWTSSMVYLQRFSGRFHLMGTWLVLTQTLATTVYLWVLLTRGDLDSYYLAAVLAAMVALVMASGLTFYIWRRIEGFPLLGRGMFAAWNDYRSAKRFLFYGNLLGYVKMLHRGADVLLVSRFCDDQTTGVYRFARSLADGLYILYDALNQVYLPRFLNLLAKKGYVKYRGLARLFVLRVGLATLAILGLEALLLTPVIRLIRSHGHGNQVSAEFPGVEATIMILTLPFFYVTGVQIWTWPVFVSSGRLGAFTTLSLVAALTHYLVGMVLMSLVQGTAPLAAMGYVAFYAVALAGVLMLLRRQRPEVLPWAGESRS